MTQSKAYRWTFEELSWVRGELESALAGPNLVLRAPGARHPEMLGEREADPTRALRLLHDRFRDVVAVEHMESDACALLSDIFYRWSILLRRIGEPTKAMDVVETALRAADAEHRHALIYSRGYARLQASGLDPLADRVVPEPSLRAAVRSWRDSAADFR